VWDWFLQAQKGRIYRIKLKSGTTYHAQIGTWSADPNDDVQEIVMLTYARVEGDKLVPIKDAFAALVARDDIKMIEALPYTVDDLLKAQPIPAGGEAAQPTDPQTQVRRQATLWQRIKHRAYFGGPYPDA
jgi:hypothetical protein